MSTHYGSVIYVERLLYNHFGIYIGGNRVIHYYKPDGNSCCDGVISETNIDKFLDGAKSYKVLDCSPLIAKPSIWWSSGLDWIKYWLRDKDVKLYSAEETVQRAKSFIGKHDYNVIFNNCEHFAIWCKTGMKESIQVEDKILNVIEFLFVK